VIAVCSDEHRQILSVMREVQVSNLIVAGRLNAKVDKVGSIIETSLMDPKNTNYQALMKQGDLLLNRIQKLSKIVDVE
jgi:26S proteasome regulatory subunit N7